MMMMTRNARKIVAHFRHQCKLHGEPHCRADKETPFALHHVKKTNDTTQTRQQEQGRAAMQMQWGKFQLHN